MVHIAGLLCIEVVSVHTPTVMHWIVYPNIHVEAETPNITVFGDMAVKEAIKVKWGPLVWS